jgi:hypothetical protein
MKNTLKALLGEHENLFPVLLARDYPHVIARIEALWGQPDMHKYLAALTPDDLGPRKGFPPEVIAEIVALRAHYQATAPAAPEATTPPPDVPQLPDAVLAPELDAAAQTAPPGATSPTPEKKPELTLAPIDDDLGDIWKNERVRKF